MDTRIKPAVTRTTHTLSFDKLSPVDFERLCLWLVRREGYERAEYLGEAGSESGRDIVAWKDGRRVAFQCKRVQKFTAATACAEIEKIRGLPDKDQPHELVFVVSQVVSVKTRDAVREAWGDVATCHFWSGSELDEMVQRHPDIPEYFFDLSSEGRWFSLKENVAKGVTDLLSLIRRRWQWIVGVALMLGAGVSGWLWWTAHQRAQLYDKGRQAMAELDFQEARMSFEEAGADRDPVVRSALAEAWMGLGKYDNARKESESAFKQRKGLPLQDRWVIEARYHKILGNWDEALPCYQRLHEKERTQVEYALGVAETQIALDRYAKALSTIEAMQKISMDPRLDLAEGQAAYYSSDFSRQVTATSRAIEKAEARGLHSLASKGLLSRGNALLSQRDMKQARDDFERAENLAGDNLEQVALVRNSVAGALAQQGELKEALRWYGKARDAYLKLDDQKGANEQNFYLAVIHEEQGKLQLARQEYEAVLREPDSLSQPEEALARGSLGSILAHQGHLVEAAESLEAAIAIFKDMGDKAQEAGYLCRLSRVHLDNLALKPAQASWQKCFDVARSQKDSPLEADALSVQGFLFLFQNDLERALRSQQDAKKLYEDAEDSFGVALKQLALAEIDLEREQAASARSKAQAALDYLDNQRALNEMARAKVFLARSFLLQGMPQRALPLVEEARRQATESGSLVLRIQVSLVEARALAAMGNVPAARKIIQRELNDPQNLGYPRLRMETRLAQGEIEILYGDRNKGREMLSLVEEDARERGFKLVETKAARLRARS